MMNETPYANSLFEQPWWLDIVAPTQWREVFTSDKNGTITGRYAYVQNENKICMPALTQTLGIWMQESVRADYGRQKSVINELFDQINEKQPVSAALAVENQYVLPFRWRGYTIEPRFTYRLTDLTDCDSIYQNLNKTAKKNIKYARNKVQIFDQVDPDILWEMLCKTFAAQKRKNPMSEEMVRKIVEVCERTNHGHYLEARDPDGNVHSCAYFVYDESVCYYLFGASDNAFRSSGAQSLLLWEGIRFASLHSRTFDFEGSMVEGIENFFRQFGGRCMPYYVIKKQGLFAEVKEILKPRVKRILGYKI